MTRPQWSPFKYSIISNITKLFMCTDLLDWRRLSDEEEVVAADISLDSRPRNIGQCGHLDTIQNLVTTHTVKMRSLEFLLIIVTSGQFWIFVIPHIVKIYICVHNILSDTVKSTYKKPAYNILLLISYIFNHFFIYINLLYYIDYFIYVKIWI